MAWPEKIIGFLFVCGSLVILWFMATSRTAGSAEQISAAGSALPHMLFGAVVMLCPLWIVLRILDFLFAGPARRKAHLIARFSP
jgi:hypothetical protein